MAAIDDLTLDQLAVFRVAAEAGSFSAAARRLGRAQSAVSYCIARLEEALGLELFDRSGRYTTLTDAGRSLLGDAHRVEEQVDLMLARARSMATGVEPTLSLAVDVFFDRARLLELLRGFRDEYAEVSLRLYTESLGAIADLVATGTCNLGISSPLDSFPSNLAVRPLTSIALVPVVAATHPLANACEVVPRATLEQHTQIVLTDRSTLTAGVEHDVYAGRVWRVADLRTKLDLIDAGFGWGSIPAHMVAERLACGELAAVRTEAHPRGEFRVPLYAVYRRDDPPGPAGRWLLATLEAMCADQAAHILS